MGIMTHNSCQMQFLSKDLDITVLVVKYGISNTIVLEVP